VTIVRALGVEGSERSAVRSRVVIPTRFVAKLDGLPQDSREVEGVYVTGSFSNWDQSFKSEYKLDLQSNGSYQRVLKIQRTDEIDYKYMIRYKDGGVTWVNDESSPIVMRGNYRNNFLQSPYVDLESRYLALNDGQ